jgi:transcriptional regulator with XRE-family HTH domain
MDFSERLREKRTQANLTQAELAKEVGVSSRTIQNYELGKRMPVNMDITRRIADVLNTTPDDLLGSRGVLVVEAQQKGGAKAARDIEELVGEVTGLFAGGQLSEDALDGAMKALNDAYWIAKENNKKYAPKKYREDATGGASE